LLFMKKAKTYFEKTSLEINSEAFLANLIMQSVINT
jgi:hypothetical protein